MRSCASARCRAAVTAALAGKPVWPGLARPGHGSGPRAAPNCASFIRIAGLLAISAGLSNLGLNVLAAAISTPLAAPVIAGMRLRGGNAASARGAASFAAPSVAAAPCCRVHRDAGGAGGLGVLLPGAHADGEADPLSYLRDELSARQMPAQHP